jgi:hypothetical protein
MATKTEQPGHSLVTTTFVQLTGVALFAILAGMSDDMGKIMLILMWGFVLGWCLLHTSELGTMVKAI